MPETIAEPWWGSVPREGASSWSGRMGPLRLWLTSAEGEHTLAWSQNADPLMEGRSDGGGGEPDDSWERARVVTRQPTLVLAPALADRPVVVRPELPLHLAPGDEATLLVSTPVWIQVTAGDPLHPLLEVPTFRPSDTWFGPSPRVGELCYASRTRARLEANASTSTFARAQTLLTVGNRAHDVLLIERINLPVPRLALFEAADGVLWSESLSVVRSDGEGFAEVTIRRGPPERLASARPIAEPRNPDSRNVFARAVSSLLG